MKLTAYLRVSTDRQAEDGNGLDAQRAAIERWAEDHGHRIVKWCSDEGVSGTIDALDREGLGCVLDGIESGLAGGVVVARLDRLARRLHVQEAALAHVWNLGGCVFAVDSGEILRDDPDDPMRTAMRQMIGVFSELDRAMVVKRMKDGRRVKAAAGGYAHGAPAYGYRAEDGELVRDATEAGVVDRMRDLRSEGLSVRAIAAKLNAEGVPSKRGGRWHGEAVRRVLERAHDEKTRV